MKAIKKSPPPVRAIYQTLEDVVGCKWSVSVLQAVAGVTRPGALGNEEEHSALLTACSCGYWPKVKSTVT
jgi:hypothetical protein